MIWEILILLAVLADIGVSIWSHWKDSRQQQDYRDEEIELLNVLADALNPSTIEAEEKQ
jgi:hypothetical protein